MASTAEGTPTAPKIVAANIKQKTLCNADNNVFLCFFNIAIYYLHANDYMQKTGK